MFLKSIFGSFNVHLLSVQVHLVVRICLYIPQYFFIFSNLKMSTTKWQICSSRNWVKNSYTVVMHQPFVSMAPSPVQGGGIAGKTCRVFTFASSPQCRASAPRSPRPEAMTFNEKKDQWNTSDPTIPDEIHEPPPPTAHRSFYFHPTPPPPQYITKNISDPLNITAAPPPQLVINDLSLMRGLCTKYTGYLHDLNRIGFFLPTETEKKLFF